VWSAAIFVRVGMFRCMSCSHHCIEGSIEHKPWYNIGCCDSTTISFQGAVTTPK
jgi:hypothetical protein